MNERFKAFWLGLFILACVVGVSWLLLFLRPSVGDGQKTLKVRFTNIEKVNIGTRVTFAGKAVGEVVAINEIFDARDMPPDSHGNLFFYELVLRVDSRVKIYKSDEIIFSTSGLLGEKSIAIIPKATPKGSEAKEVTTDVLYAKSQDKLEETLSQIVDVAMTFDKTLGRLNSFLDENSGDIACAIRNFCTAADEATKVLHRANETDFAGKVAIASVSLNQAMESARDFFRKANDSGLIDKIEYAATNLGSISHQISSGQGTFGKLIYGDSLYLQLSTTLADLDTTLSTINDYGLLFQFDSNWRKKRKWRNKCMQKINTSCDVYNSFNSEVRGINDALGRIYVLIDAMKCNEGSDPAFAERLKDVLQQVDTLENKLKLYNLQLFDECSAPN